MAQYFVYENKHYPSPGAREKFEVRQRGFMDVTIEFCPTKEAADALCARLIKEAEADEMARVAKNRPSMK